MFNAAKRVIKKRGAPGSEDASKSPLKRARTRQLQEMLSPAESEAALALPISSLSEEELSRIVLLTNRAPLVLAFAFCVLKYTMPEQPISSRLSLAQAVVSANSRTKAISLGLESGKSAEEVGWGEGQPVIKVLGREVRVLKRWGYNPNETENSMASRPTDQAADSASLAAKHAKETDELTDQASECLDNPPLWGLDLEALRKSDRRGSANELRARTALPIFTAESARAYLLKSFTRAKGDDSDEASKNKRTKVSNDIPEKEHCLSHLLQAIDILCQSWAAHLDAEELDRRAWAWYLKVRPEVQSGVGGWGEKGFVKLSDILALRRDS